MNAERRKPGTFRRFDRGLSALIRLVDVGCVGLVLIVSTRIFAVEWIHGYSYVAVIAMALFALGSEYFRIYTSWRAAPLGNEIVAVSLTWIAVVVALLVLGYASKTTADFSRLALGTWFLGTLVLIAGQRVGLRILLRYFRYRGFNTRSLAVVGDNEVAAHVVETVTGAPWMGFRLVGVFDDRRACRMPTPVSKLEMPAGTFAELIKAIEDGAVDVVYVSLPLSARARLEEMLTRLANTTVSIFVIPDFFLFEILGGRWSTLGDIPAVSVCETPFFGLHGWLKRLEDILLSLLILPSIALPMALVTLAIKLDSRGPVLFQQIRYGLNGKPFRVWKFRSMSVQENGAVIEQAKRDDPRVTRVGRFIRRYSLDELPQFFNVLVGEMSIVGPRPHAVAHNEYFRVSIRGYMLRHKVKPGITGWAQVNGWRGETDDPEKMVRRVDHDLWYIRNWSLMLDLKIVLMTALLVLRQKDVY